MGSVVDFPGARNRVLLVAWKQQAAGWCPVANASRRAMRSWYRLDRGANRQGYVAHAVGAAFGIDPATVRIDPAEDEAALLRFTVATQRPRTLEPHEHAACVRYWHERLRLLAKLAEAVQGAREPAPRLRFAGDQARAKFDARHPDRDGRRAGARGMTPVQEITAALATWRAVEPLTDVATAAWVVREKELVGELTRAPTVTTGDLAAKAAELIHLDEVGDFLELRAEPRSIDTTRRCI